MTELAWATTTGSPSTKSGSRSAEGLAGLLGRWLARVPWPAQLAVFALLAATLPFWMDR